MDIAAPTLSLELAGPIGILVALGLPIASWLATTGWRAKFPVKAVVALPLVLPPTAVLGFYLLVGPFAGALAGVDVRLLEACHAFGVSALGTFTKVTLPLACTLGVFSHVLMVGGNIPGRTRSLSVAIFDRVEALECSAAHRTAGLRRAISFVVLALVYARQRRPFFRWNER